MKKLLVTLIVAFAFGGSVFAQSYETHYPGFYDPDYDFQVALVAAIQINGELIDENSPNWQALEVVAFINGVQRSYGMYLSDYGHNEYGDPYIYIDGDAIYYTTAASEPITFKMYDHLNEIEYTEFSATLEGEPYTVLMTGEDIDQGWWDPENPLFLNFIGEVPSPEPTTITGGLWNAGSTWEDEEVPAAGTDVIINGPVTIPSDYTANAGTITIVDGGSLTILDGGQLYHTGEVYVAMQMNVTGWDTKDNNAGYRLIAPAVHSTETNSFIPVEGTNLNTGAFDLYYFDQAGDVENGYEWINYKKNDTEVGFENLTLGQGYLYANHASLTDVVLRGYTLPTSINYTLASNLGYTSGKEFAGWNLVGNPYTCDAYVTVNGAYSSYYVLNGEGDGINETVVSANTPIAPMQGIFVKATAANQSCFFTTAAPSKGSNLNITVNQANAMVDNAIVSFDNGSTLEKLQFNPNQTKVYMPVEGKDYAVAKADSQGEMPVNFQAQENGTYTINFNAQNVEFSYLHLIDNMTGNDVDLLDNPSYSFDARTTDYTSRFKLVFATGTNSSESNFGFISDGNLMILGIEGEATLQIIDVTGRILSTETFSGSYSKAINEATGVYMLRLIQGSDVKTQKIVVK